MTLIGVDLDGVIANPNPEFIRRAQVELKQTIDENDLTFGWELLSQKYNIDDKWFLKSLYKDEWFWAKTAPYEDSIETLHRWGELGHEVHIIADRPKDTITVTRGWLKRYKVPFTQLTFEPIMHKVDYIKRLEIPVTFEDRFYEANKIGAFGIKSFIVRRPWNADFEPRVTNPLVTFIDNLESATEFIGGLNV